MPNHCINLVSIQGPQERLIEIDNLVRTEGNPFNFDKIVHMPEYLNGEYCYMAIEDAKKFVNSKNADGNPNEFAKQFVQVRGWCVKDHDAYIKDFVQAVENYRKCGFCYWLDWALTYWGTKWNSYDHGECSVGEYNYFTANGPGDNVLGGLSVMFPDVVITLQYSNEDALGCHGTMTFENGAVTDNTLDPGSPEALAFYEEMWGVSADEMDEEED